METRSNSAPQKNFFDRLTSKNILKDPEKTKLIVKTLKSRLEDKLFSEKFSLVHKSIGLIPSGLESTIALGSFCAPQLALGLTLTPIAAGFAGSLAVAKIFLLFYKHRQKQNFIANMERYTTANITSNS